MPTQPRRGRPPRAGDAVERVEGVVSAVVPGGQGLIRDGQGVVLARGGLPGERVEVEVRRIQRRVRHGVVLRVLEASPSRKASTDCALHPQCGGCDLLDLQDGAAADARISIVRDALARVGRLSEDVVSRALRPIVTPTAGDVVDVHAAKRRRARFVVVGGVPTFSAAESHDRVPVERCPALHPLLEAALALVPRARLADRTGLRLAVDDRGRISAALEHATAADAARLVEVGAAHGVVVVDGDVELGRAGDPVLLGEVAPGFGPCASDAACFTQATRFGGQAITRAVVEAAGDVAGKRVLELFAGAGHLTVPLLEAGADVLAIEGAPRSVRYLEQNVIRYDQRARVRRAFIDGSLKLTGVGGSGGTFDVVVADPPRTGVPGLPTILANVKAPVVVLVSCDVATGARDLANALKKGYALDSLVPIDAFPRTSHVEWVARLTKAPRTAT